MIIELENWEYDLIDMISTENCTDYYIKEKEGKRYIDKYNLMCALEDTQDLREFAEGRVIELSRALNSDNIDELIDRLLRAEGNLRKAKKEIKKLQENLEIATSVFNEDHWDRAFEEGFINERY